MMMEKKKMVDIQVCGCFIVDKIVLPKKTVVDNIDFSKKNDAQMSLKSSEYEVEIVNSVANVNIKQTYQNQEDKFLQVYYKFPVFPGSCVYKFTASFGNMRIEGVIKQKTIAKEQYKQAIQSGKNAALAQIDDKNKDILKLQIGNIAPKQIVTIQISYIQQLTLTSNTFYELRIQGTIHPRYFSLWPRQILAKSCRNQIGKTKGQHYWNFKIILKTTRKVSFFDSKSHKLQLLSQNDTQTQSIIVMNSQCIPTNDFVFTYTTENFQLPSYVLGRTDFSSTAMISFIPKFCDLNVNDAYQASITNTPYEVDIDNAKGQYIFLLDRSGSMKGKRIQKAKQSLILFIKSLPQDVYFNIISFGSGYQQLFPQSVKYNDNYIKDAVNKVKNMYADMGGTEIYYPLSSQMTKKPIIGYPKQIFLLTDGAVGYATAIFDLIEANNKYSRVHTIGIGNGASQQLVIGAAKSGKGYYTLITDNQNPSQKIIQLLTDSLSPVISKMSLQYDAKIIESIMPNPKSLPYILKNEIVNFYITFRGQIDKKTTLKFSYEDSMNKLPYKSQIQIDPQSQNQSFIDRMSNFKKIETLQNAFEKNIKIQDHIYFAKQINPKNQIIQLSTKSQILSRFTAFISIQKELIDGKYEEIKEIGQMKVSVNNNAKEPQIRKKMQKSSNCLRRNMVGTLAMPKSSILSNNIKTVQIEQKQPVMKKNRAKMVQKRQVKQCFDMQDQSCYIEPISKPMAKKQTMINMKDTKFKEQQKKSNKNQFDINEIIGEQLSEGYWKNIFIIQKLFGINNIKKLLNNSEIIYKKISNSIIITFLIIKWIEKYHPSKQYSLVIKKANNYLKREGYAQDMLLEICKEIKI